MSAWVWLAGMAVRAVLMGALLLAFDAPGWAVAGFCVLAAWTRPA